MITSITLKSMKASASEMFTSSSQRSTRQRILELPFFAIFPTVVGSIVFSSNALGIASGYLWVAAFPVIYAARYGSGWGTLCALVAAFVWMQPIIVLDGSLTQRTVMAVGTLCLSIVVGATSDNWRKRSSRSEAENAYLRHRLKEFSNDYHVLKVSHGHLEEFMAGQRLSLRSALQALTPRSAGP